MHVYWRRLIAVFMATVALIALVKYRAIIWSLFEPVTAPAGGLSREERMAAFLAVGVIAVAFVTAVRMTISNDGSQK